MGHFSSDLGSQFLGGDRTEKNFLVGSTKYIRILVGSRGPILRGGPDRSPTSHKGSDRTFFLSDLGSQCLGGGSDRNAVSWYPSFFFTRVVS